jgi:hypothetical protein
MVFWMSRRSGEPTLLLTKLTRRALKLLFSSTWKAAGKSVLMQNGGGRGFRLSPWQTASERFVGDSVGNGLRAVKRSRKSLALGGRPLRREN